MRLPPPRPNPQDPRTLYPMLISFLLDVFSLKGQTVAPSPHPQPKAPNSKPQKFTLSPTPQMGIPPKKTLHPKTPSPNPPRPYRPGGILLCKLQAPKPLEEHFCKQHQGFIPLGSSSSSSYTHGSLSYTRCTESLFPSFEAAASWAFSCVNCSPL